MCHCRPVGVLRTARSASMRPNAAPARPHQGAETIATVTKTTMNSSPRVISNITSLESSLLQFRCPSQQIASSVWEPTWVTGSKVCAKVRSQIASFCEVSAVSALYETFPVGPPQPLFLNAALRVLCTLEPEVLLTRLLAVEHSFGRTRTERWGPRTLDLDILWIRDTAASQCLPVRPAQVSRRTLLRDSASAGCRTFRGRPHDRRRLQFARRLASTVPVLLASWVPIGRG